MVLDLNIQKVPLAWYSIDQEEAMEKKMTWMSVPHGFTIDEACEVLEQDPLDWELADGAFLVGFTEYRRKEDD